MQLLNKNIQFREEYCLQKLITAQIPPCICYASRICSVEKFLEPLQIIHEWTSTFKCLNVALSELANKRQDRHSVQRLPRPMRFWNHGDKIQFTVVGSTSDHLLSDSHGSEEWVHHIALGSNCSEELVDHCYGWFSLNTTIWINTQSWIRGSLWREVSLRRVKKIIGRQEAASFAHHLDIVQVFLQLFFVGTMMSQS